MFLAITLTYFDHSYITVAGAFYFRLRDLGIDNLCMVTMDEDSRQTAIDLSLPFLTVECLLNNCHEWTNFTKSSMPVQMGAVAVNFKMPRIFHPKISLLRAVLETGADILFIEMDVIVYQNPYRQPRVNALFEKLEEEEMLLSAHCNHPRVNIGLLAIRSNNRTNNFMGVLEMNWQLSDTWDQSLWDGMLNNYDTLRPDLIQEVDNITWGKLDCCAFAEDGRTYQGQHANLHLASHEHPPAVKATDINRYGRNESFA